jgi:hypothetical protein
MRSTTVLLMLLIVVVVIGIAIVKVRLASKPVLAVQS